MAKPKGNRIDGLDIGGRIRANMLSQRMSHAMLARRLKRNQSTVKNIIHNSSIQTYLIWELSVALGHNFFTDLAQQLDAATEGKLTATGTELEELRTECKRLREERDYLRMAVKTMADK